MLSMLSYSSFIAKKEAFYAHDHSIEKNIWSKIQDGELFIPIEEIIDTDNNDHFSHFEKYGSSYMPHDPLYGYHGHYFLPVTQKGKTRIIDENGNFNFHNPLSFYNPSKLGEKRELICGNDQSNFELFINRKQPKWVLPPIQRIANYVSVISLFIFILYLVFSYIKKFITN